MIQKEFAVKYIGGLAVSKVNGDPDPGNGDTYVCISADSHIDMVWLPPDLFVANAYPRLRDRMPRVVESDEGPRWVSKHGTGQSQGRAGLSGGVGSSGKPYVPGANRRADAMAAEGIYSEESRQSCRLTDPHQRVKDQDRDGVQAEVLYGILGSLGFLNDVEASWEVCRIYNDWLADFCKTYPDRLLGLPVIPGTDVGAAVGEFNRISGGDRLRGIELGTSHDMLPFYDDRWEPLWRVLAEADVPLHVHGMGQPWPTDGNLSPRELAAASAMQVSKAPFSFVPLICGLIFGGALERHPTLKLVLGESGIGWIPFLLDRMDFEWEEAFTDKLDLTMRPSDYWRRQCKATFQFDVVGLHLLDFLGVETLMWASDFPHPQGTWPDSREFIARQFGHLSADIRDRIVRWNAIEFYGIEPGVEARAPSAAG